MAPHPADMNPGEIERLSTEVVPGSGALDIQPLSVGLLNETYRVVRNGSAYVLRLAVARPDLAGDRAWKTKVLEKAGRSGFAPLPVYSDPVKGVLLTPWVDGRFWSVPETRQSRNLSSFAHLLHRVHALEVPSPACAMSPATWVDLYGSALSRGLKRSDQDLSAAAASRLAQLADLPMAAKVVCHSDLHTMNLIERAQSLILLDWEYAHMSEAMWDLAGWSANNDFADETQQELLWNYCGMPPTSSQWSRFRLLSWLYDYICLLWSQLYLSVRGEAGNGVSERATQLDARLRLPAHYAA
jgi:thiamine kinase-like enzyme